MRQRGRRGIVGALIDHEHLGRQHVAGEQRVETAQQRGGPVEGGDGDRQVGNSVRRHARGDHHPVSGAPAISVVVIFLNAEPFLGDYQLHTSQVNRIFARYV